MKTLALSIVLGLPVLAFAVLSIVTPAETEAASYCDSQGQCTGPSANDWNRYQWANDPVYRDVYRFGPYRYEYLYREGSGYPTRDQRTYACPRRYWDNARLCAKHRYDDDSGYRYSYDDYDDYRYREDSDWWYRYEYRYSY